MLEKLDKALLRPGRFDRQVFVPPPDMRGRERILEVHTQSKPLAQDVDLERVARHAAGLTGADLANLAQRGGDPRRPHTARVHRPGRLRRRLRAGRRGAPVAQGDHRPREAGRRLARGRARDRVRAAADRRQGPEGVDRPARQGAGLHAQPPAGGPLPEVARGADRLHEGAARGPRRRADHVRASHHRRRRRPEASDRDRALDGLRVRDGHPDPRAPGPGRRLRRLRGPARRPATRRSRRSRRRHTAAPTACSPTTATCSTRSPSGCSTTRSIEREEISEIMRAHREQTGQAPPKPDPDAVGRRRGHRDASRRERGRE